jgi:hypothetical protein
MSNTPSKKTFVTPELVVYGDIRKITMAVGATGSSDGTTINGGKSQV